MSKSISSSFYLLDDRVQRWVYKQNWSSLRDIQESTIPYILDKDKDVIISASTAGGKTEAAFLGIITSILKNNDSGYSVLYISPLKALINDQCQRLEDMVNGLYIDVTPWHGDIDVSRKRKSLKIPNGIIIITPESLESFFINRKQYLSKAFSNLSYIVIDELHYFIGTERGKQLQSLLSRVENISNRIIPRIALSATFSDYEVVRSFLRNNNSIPCVIPPTGVSNHEIKILIKEYLSGIKTADVDSFIVKDMYDKLRGTNNLIFANGRVDVEKYASMLTDLCENNSVPNEFRVHHGNLSKSERKIVEYELQKGIFPISAVCTSTLELGIDIGKVKSIVQIGTANSVSGLRQRLGRSGRRGEASILRIYSIDYAKDNIDYNLKVNLFKNIAVVELLKDKHYEKPVASNYHFSTLIQQILSLLCQYGGFQVKDGWSYLCNNGAFKNISPELFMDLLRSLGEANVINQTHSGEIIIGIEGEKIVKLQDFYTAFKTSIDYILIDKDKSKPIGSLQYMPKVGEFVILGGRKWNIISTDEKSKKFFGVRVKHGELPFFDSESADIDALIVNKMKEIYSLENKFLYLDECGRESFDSGCNFFKSHTLQANSFFNYGGEKVLMTWQGHKVNRTISFMLRLVDDIVRWYNYIYIENVTLDDILKLKSLSKPKYSDLTLLVSNRKMKECQKYDYLLSDSLLDIEYAHTYLDIDAAWDYISNEINY
ncbi:MAG: DEAD/DEAH box helicase [Bacteroidales bacterium]